MTTPSIDGLWVRLKALQGERFETKTGRPFTYDISGDVFRPSRTRYNISKADFRKALALMPFDGPGVISDTVRGPSYVWAVLHDKRVLGKHRPSPWKPTPNASRWRNSLSGVLAVARSLSRRGRGRKK